MSEKKTYHKRIGLNGLKHIGKDLLRLENIILKLGYTTSDYKINHYGSDIEIILTNQDLHRDLKTIRRTIYNK